MTAAQVIRAPWTWTGERFEPDLQIEIAGDGRIARVGDFGLDPDLTLEHTALLPGFVNAHSHAFQRGLRGLGESFPHGAGSFWTWRQAMYGLVESLDDVSVYRWSRRAFDEMRAAGITTVGEFHYLHHAVAGELDFGLDEIVLRAAGDSGLRVVLLEAYYRTGAIDEALSGGQLRFATPDPEAYWRQIDALTGHLDAARQSIGAVAHSIRAADPGEIVELHAEARRRGMVFHMHLEEQRQEIEACRERYDSTPLGLIADRVEPGPEFTAVHCTHSVAPELEAFAAHGAGVCVCPLTEANLADGIADLPAMDTLAMPTCLGTDSNARISMLEEMRWLEYVQRLARERRGVLTVDGNCAARLLGNATLAGADALGIETGRIEAGRWADFVAIDLEHPSLAGWSAETLASTLVFGGADGVIAATCVGGEWKPASAPAAD